MNEEGEKCCADSLSLKILSSMSEFDELRKHEKTQHALYWQKDQCTSVQFSSVQFSSRWLLCTREVPYALHPISQEFPAMLPLKQFQCWSDCRWPFLILSRKIIEHFLFLCLSLIDGVMSLALCMQVVSQSPQHFRSSETQPACDGCFAHQSVWSVISFDAGMSRTLHPYDISKVDVEHWHMPVTLS